MKKLIQNKQQLLYIKGFFHLLLQKLVVKYLFCNLKLAFHETFLYAFFYPLIIVAIVSVIYATLKVINFKSVKLAKILDKIIFIVGFTFLTLILLLVIVLVLNKLLHFWF